VGETSRPSTDPERHGPLPRWIALAALGAAAALAPASLAGPDPVSTERFTVLDPASLLPGTPIIEGGNSGLDAVDGSSRLYWTVTDRGPNGQPTLPAPIGQVRTFPVPGFAPRIKLLRAGKDGHLRTLAEIPLRLARKTPDPTRRDLGLPGGSQITGFPDIAASAPSGPKDELGTLADGSPLDAAGKPLGILDPYGLDTEGVAAGHGGFWLSDEYRPSLIQVSLTGTILQRIVPADTPPLGDESVVPLRRILPAIYSKRRANRGMEGVALSGDGRHLYGIVQNGLDTRPTQTAGGVPIPNGANPNLHRLVRLAEIDLKAPGGPKLSREFLYQIDENTTGKPAGASAANRQDQSRVGDLSWLGPNRLAVVDRDDSTPGPDSPQRKVIYAIELDGATDLLGLEGDLAADRDSGALDACTPELLAAAGVAPTPKSAILDVGAATPTARWRG
jgi:Esterase-like activity of phytase